MTKEKIKAKLNYLVDFATSNSDVNNPQMMTNCADDILKYIDELQKENEELKKTIRYNYGVDLFNRIYVSSHIPINEQAIRKVLDEKK